MMIHTAGESEPECQEADRGVSRLRAAGGACEQLATPGEDEKQKVWVITSGTAKESSWA